MRKHSEERRVLAGSWKHETVEHQSRADGKKGPTAPARRDKFFARQCSVKSCLVEYLGGGRVAFAAHVLSEKQCAFRAENDSFNEAKL